MSRLLTRRDVLFFALATLLVAGLAIYLFSQPVTYEGALITPPKAMQDFTLQSGSGPVTLSSFRGKVVVIFFGYTNCPDICPLTMAFLRQALDHLGEKAKEVQVLFISVDWKRDTPERLANYTAAFRPDFIGLTGTQAQIDAVTHDFGIFYLLNVPDTKGYYSVDHTATILVLNRQGGLTLTWPNGTQSDAMASDLLKLIKQ